MASNKVEIKIEKKEQIEYIIINYSEKNFSINIYEDRNLENEFNDLFNFILDNIKNIKIIFLDDNNIDKDSIIYKIAYNGLFENLHKELKEIKDCISNNEK